MPLVNRRRPRRRNPAMRRRKRAAAPARRGFHPKRKYHKKAVKKYTSVNGVVNTSYATMQNHKPTSQIKNLERVGEPQVQIRNFANVIAGQTGLQNYYDFVHLGNAQLSQIRNNLPSSANNAGARFVLESYMTEILVTNTTTASCELEFYDVIPTRDIAAATTYATPTATTYLLDPLPTSYWETGVLVNANLLPSTSPANQPSRLLGGTPFDSQLFRDYFKVIRRTRVLLTQGGSHRHFISLRVNALVDDALIGNEAMSAMRGLSAFTMMVFKGMPNTTGATGLVASTNITQLAFTQSQRIKYSWVTNYSNNLFTNATITQPTSTQVVNIGSGAIDPVVLATT